MCIVGHSKWGAILDEVHERVVVVKLKAFNSKRSTIVAGIFHHFSLSGVARGMCNNKKNTKQHLYAYVSVMGKTPKEKHGNERRRPYNYPRNAQAQTQNFGTESRNYSYPSGNVPRYSKHW
jgi:hypothetical protein